MARLEHINLTVSDPHKAARRLAALFDWQVRWEGPHERGGYTVHVGEAGADNTSYVSLYAGPGYPHAPRGYDKGQPLNHLGVVVDDLGQTEDRAKDLGLKPFGHADYTPGRRFYLFDEDGIEIEVVSYA